MVTGSNDPGQTARRTSGSSEGSARSGRRDRTKGRRPVADDSVVSPYLRSRPGEARPARRAPAARGPLDDDQRRLGASQPRSTSARRSRDHRRRRQGVRRVEEHHVVRRRRRGRPRCRGDRSEPRTSAPAKPSVAGVGADQPRRSPVLLDERHRAGAPRQRLEPDRARSRRTGRGSAARAASRARTRGGEQRLADPVGGRAGCGRPRGVWSRRPPASPPMMRVIALSR